LLDIFDCVVCNSINPDFSGHFWDFTDMKEKDFHKLTDGEKNALVAEKVAGYKKLRTVNTYGENWATFGTSPVGKRGIIPNYRHDMNLCMELVKDYARFHLTKRSEHSLLPKWRCDIRDKETYLTIGGDADTPQEAIIIACLKAEGVLED
jgi:hypothetical protein